MINIKPEFILARENNPDEASIEVSEISTETYLEETYSRLVIAERERLESNDSYRQILPYIVLTRLKDGVREVFVYRRTKNSGEDKLKLKHSIGLGGHIDIDDIVCREDQSIDLRQTISLSLIRELGEEVKNINGVAVRYLIPRDEAGQVVLPDHILHIQSNDTEVDRFHECIGILVEVPDDLVITENENQIEAVGFFPVEEVMQKVPNVESWSEKIIKHLMG